MAECHFQCVSFISLREVFYISLLRDLIFCINYYLFLDSHMELQIMYAGTKMALQREANLTRVYEVRELDEMTDEWLQDCVMGK